MSSVFSLQFESEWAAGIEVARERSERAEEAEREAAIQRAKAGNA